MAKHGSKFKDQVGADNEREKARGSSYGHLMLPRGVKMLQVEGGDRIKLDFLPYVVTDAHHPCRNDERDVALPGTQWYRRPYKLHRNIGAANESVVCPTSIGKRCPICEYRVKTLKEGKGDEEQLKNLKPSDRNLYVVVPKHHNDLDEVPHIFDISRYCFQDTLREETDENPEYRAFFDPSEDGFTLNIRFSEEKLGKNKFAAVSRIDFEERKQGYDDSFMKKVPNLDEVVTVLSFKEIEAKFFELDDDGTPPKLEDEEEATPSVHKRPQREETERKRKVKVEEEEEEKEEEEEEEHEPQRKHKSHKTKVEDEEEQEETEEEEEEESNVKHKKDRHVTKHVEPEEEEEEEKEEETDPKDVCVACNGDGENSKGKICPICRGTGVRKRSKVVENEEKEEERRLVRRRNSQSNDDQKESKLVRTKCPAGHTFGKDCDKYPKQCSDCPQWDACFDAGERN